MTATQQNNEVSARIKMLRFPLILAVVFIHNYACGSVASDDLPAGFNLIRYFISQGIARVAVPLFFMISAYLFFENYGPDNYLIKLKRRLRTLLIPLIVWNLIILILNQFTTHPVHGLTLTHCLSERWAALRLIKYTIFKPVDFPLWFLRDLIALSISAPLIHRLVRARFSAIAIFFLALPWMFFGHWADGARWLTARDFEGFLFFLVGSYLAIHRIDLRRLDFIAPVLAFSSLIVFIVFTAYPGPEDPTTLETTSPTHLVNCALGAGKLLSIPVFWWLAGQASSFPIPRKVFIKLGSASFLVFVAHAWFLSVIRNMLAWHVYHDSNIVLLSAYFLVPIAVVAILVLLNEGLCRGLPKVAIALGCMR